MRSGAANHTAKAWDALWKKDWEMAIGTAVQSGKIISIYDEKGRRLTNLSVGSGAKDGLQGFTSATVSVRFGNVVNIYNERGRRLSIVSAGR